MECELRIIWNVNVNNLNNLNLNRDNLEYECEYFGMRIDI